MALIKTLPDPQGPGEIEAYAKYSRFSFNTDSREMRMTLSIYRSQAARDAVDGQGRQLYHPVSEEEYVVNDSGSSGPAGPLPSGPDYVAYQAADNANSAGVGNQIYLFLKTFTAWTGSKDA